MEISNAQLHPGSSFHTLRPRHLVIFGLQDSGHASAQVCQVSWRVSRSDEAQRKISFFYFPYCPHPSLRILYLRLAAIYCNYATGPHPDFVGSSSIMTFIREPAMGYAGPSVMTASLFSGLSHSGWNYMRSGDFLSCPRQNSSCHTAASRLEYGLGRRPLKC